MSAFIKQAVILAAGRGTRMGELTATVPKPMLEVHGRPMMEHVLERLAAAGVERFFIVVGYRREAIEDYFRGWRLPIAFQVQDPVDGTGSAARLARGFAGKEPFFLTFGDILCDSASYTACAEVMKANDCCEAVLGVRHVDDPWRGAAVYETAGKVTRVIEKPPQGTSTTHWNSAGLFALQPAAFDYLDRLTPSARNEYELTAIFDQMVADGRIVCMSEMQGDWRDVGRPEDLAAVNSPPQPADDAQQYHTAKHENAQKD